MAAIAGAATGLALTGAWLLLYGASLAPFPPLDLADLFIRTSPGGFATWGIENFGHSAQVLIQATAIAT